MPVKAKNYRALTGQGDGEAKNYTLAEMKDLCNDNLLINSDFRHGAINQKGQTSYSANTYADAYKYCIDMWMISNSGVGNTVTVNDDSITLATSLRYYFDRQLEDGTYALTISFNGVVQTRTFNVSNGSGNGTQIFQSGGQTLGVLISQRFLSLSRQSDNASFNIDFIKLEKGNSYTGMPEWNEGLELLKCMRYYQPFYVLAHRNSESENTPYYSIDTMFPVPMAKSPTVNVTKVYTPNGDDITSSTTVDDIGVSYRNVGTVHFGEKHGFIMLKIDLILDAYQY